MLHRATFHRLPTWCNGATRLPSWWKPEIKSNIGQKSARRISSSRNRSSFNRGIKQVEFPEQFFSYPPVQIRTSPAWVHESNLSISARVSSLGSMSLKCRSSLSISGDQFSRFHLPSTRIAMLRFRVTGLFKPVRISFSP